MSFFKIQLFLCSLFFCYASSLSISSRLRQGPRVLNGEDAQIGQFPYHVGVASVTEAEFKLCSGVIISENWILTAAFCLENADFVRIHAGTIDNYKADGVIVEAYQYFIHEEFSNLTLQNDMGLVHLYQNLTFNENLTSIALPDDELGSGVEATITGWGHSSHDSSNNDTFTLQYASVSTIENADCQKVYGTDAIAPSMICTSGGDSGKTPCFGDAGGPLVVNADSDPVLVALFSFIGGDNCAEFPAGYTRIAYYRKWIQDKTGL